MIKRDHVRGSLKPVLSTLALLLAACGANSESESAIGTQTAKLEADPDCTPSTYEAEGMYHSTGGATPGGWNIWSNGYISTTHDFDGGTTQVTAVVAGHFGGGAAPQMQVTVDGEVVYTTAVGSSSWTPYNFTFEAAGGEQEIRIYFTNDYYQNGQDRNLLVDKLIVGCGTGLCGNGTVDPGEECDDGNQTSNDSCTTACAFNTCGDGELYTLLTDTSNPNSLEDCDDENDVDTDSCTNVCAFNACGDGIQYLEVTNPDNPNELEECDDGNDDDSDGCTNACLLNEYCGDGVVSDGEECDDGNDDDTDSCTNACSFNTCGDGTPYLTVTDYENPNPLEECDDGNDDDDDACSNSCELNEYCGDGIVSEGEECDDGNEDDTDSCTSTCLFNTCGDGNVYTTVTDYANPNSLEECDDGNDDDGDECSNSCELNEYCGDGVVSEGEECDDGNDDDTDSCTSTCLFNACGDGNVYTTETDPSNPNSLEECDDGNTAPGDGCDAMCLIESEASVSAELTFFNQWPSGYCVSLAVTNDGDAATTDWEAVIDTHGATIYTAWSANFTGTSGELGVTPLYWNAVIAPGATNSSVGFCATRGAGVPDPEVVSVEGSF